MPTAESTTGALSPRTGWGVLHLFCRLAGHFDAAAVRAAAKTAGEQGLQVVTVALLGHKADIGFVVVGPDLWSHQGFQRAVPEAMKQARLYPELPPECMRAFCFYPMSKRREPSWPRWPTTPSALSACWSP